MVGSSTVDALTSLTWNAIWFQEIVATSLNLLNKDDVEPLTANVIS